MGELQIPENKIPVLSSDKRILHRETESTFLKGQKKVNNSKIDKMSLHHNKAIMQIQLDQNDPESIIEDLKEYASTLSGALGFNTSEILEEMSMEDTEHLIKTFNKYFSEYIELLESDHVIISRNK